LKENEKVLFERISESDNSTKYLSNLMNKVELDDSDGITQKLNTIGSKLGIKV